MICESVYSGDNLSPINVMQAFFDRLRQGKFGDELDLTKMNIHKLFFAVQKEQGFPLKSFYFNGNKKFPFSQQIEDVLYEMTVCGMLTRPNPTMMKYNFVSLDTESYDNLDTSLKNIVDTLVQRASTVEMA